MATLTGVSLPTIQRFFSGHGTNISLDTVNSIADVLGIRLEAREEKTEHAILQERAQEKAHALASIVYGTSALEEQGLKRSSAAAVKDKFYHALMSGPKSKIWSST